MWHEHRSLEGQIWLLCATTSWSSWQTSVFGTLPLLMGEWKNSWLPRPVECSSHLVCIWDKLLIRLTCWDVPNAVMLYDMLFNYIGSHVSLSVEYEHNAFCKNAIFRHLVLSWSFEERTALPYLISLKFLVSGISMTWPDLSATRVNLSGDRHSFFCQDCSRLEIACRSQIRENWSPAL